MVVKLDRHRRPLRLLAQGHAWHAGQVGLLLQATRIGEERLRAAQQAGEVEVAERLAETDLATALELAKVAGATERGARAGVDGEDQRPVAARGKEQDLGQTGQRLGGVDVAGAMGGGEQVVATAQAEAIERPRAAIALGPRAAQALGYVACSCVMLRTCAYTLVSMTG